MPSTTTTTTHLQTNRRAALYARVSSERQREEETIAFQKAEIESTIDQVGDVLLPKCSFIDDGYTGELLVRPALDQLRDAARRGEFDVLYVYDRGRLSRLHAHQEVIIEELRDLGIDFVSLRDFDANDPESRVFQSMQGVFHEYERVKIAERFRQARMFKVRAGNFIGYVAKYGYHYERKTPTSKGQLSVDPVEAAVVRKIFHWYGEDGLNIRGIVKRLYEEGILPRKSTRGVWHISTVLGILRDEIYVGRHYYNKKEAIPPKSPEMRNRYRRVKNTATRPRPKSDWIVVPVPPIIDEALFDQVQSRRAANAVRSSRNAKVEYLLRGVVRCPCGSARTCRVYRGRNPIYRCGNSFDRYPLPATCKRGSVRADVADAVIWDHLRRALTDPAFLRELANLWLLNKNSDASSTGNMHSIVAIDKALEKLRVEETRYARAYGGGNLTEEVFRSLASDTRAKREELQRKRDALPATTIAKALPTVDELVELAVAGASSLDITDRQRVFGLLVESVILDQDGAVVTGCLPLQSASDEHLRPRAYNAIDPNRSTPINMSFELVISLPQLRPSRLYLRHDTERFLQSLDQEPRSSL